MARYLQRGEHLAFTDALGRKPAAAAALLTGKLHGRDGVAVFRSALAVSAPSVPAPNAEGVCVPKPGPTAAEALNSCAVRSPAVC
jgi:hypothetical protein